MMIRTLDVVGTGTSDDPRRPDLPEGVGYRVVDDHGDTMDVEVLDDADDRLAAVEAKVEAAAALASDAAATAQEVAAAMRDAAPRTR